MDKWLYDKRAVFWNDYLGLEHAKAFMGNLSKRRCRILLQMNRVDIRLMTGSLTGHFPGRHVLKRMHVITDDSCRFCDDEVESVEHLLCSYVAKEDARRRWRKNCTPDPSYFNNIDLSRLV